jgi:hypothetical protein
MLHYQNKNKNKKWWWWYKWHMNLCNGSNTKVLKLCMGGDKKNVQLLLTLLTYLQIQAMTGSDSSRI